MKKIVSTIFLLVFGCAGIIHAQVRTEYLLEKNWRFTHDDNSSFVNPDFDDSQWQQVIIPHDWAIYGPFSEQNDVQNVAIAQDGQTKAVAHAGRTGGLPFTGVGWYRTTIDLPQFEAGKRVVIVFDGAMSHAEVYVNGQKAGYWPYGYNSFYLDITSFVNTGKNSLAVRLENRAESARWYPGAGLYRNVHLIVTEDAHIPVWGTYITTPTVNKVFAKVNVKTEIVLPEGADPDSYTLETSIWNANKQQLITLRTPLTQIKYNNNVVSQDFFIQKPMLWSPETPVLYTAASRLYKNVELKDMYISSFGIRSIEVIRDKGFFLNGEKIMFKGVCNHHDLGPLGAAVNDAAIRRQIRILKDMGCNAIRTSHNMPAPELVKACDEMGMMLMAESFDEWSIPKCKNGYNLLFKDWSEKDMVNLVRHFRNNPSVVMWSIGNEVPNQGHEGDCKIAQWLQDICHREDPSRPVTQGLDQVGIDLVNNFAAVMDIPGFNYRLPFYQEGYKKLPQGVVLGSETASTVSARGVYKFPVERKENAKYDDHQSSSYDVECCGWSNLPDDDFILQDDLPYCIGQFVWTGFDYLGEPTPYYTDWPNHSSMFGIIDLAGIPKDRYYLYRSQWNTSDHTLHILPHWTWPGREGQVTPVFVYTDYPSAELFINGISQGKRTKDLSIKVEGSDTEVAYKGFERQKRYRLMWMNTKYEPGSLKVVAYDKEGKAVAEETVRTAGKPHHLVLTADRKRMKADGKDLIYINVRACDKDGNLCPDVSLNVKFSVAGNGIYRAAANGDATCMESFQETEMSLFKGQLEAIVQSTEKSGAITFTASAAGVKSATIDLLSDAK